MEYRIAIAGNDGLSVNQHFGRAENFLIYEIKDGKVEFIEDRIVNIESAKNSNSEARIEHIKNLLCDCKMVFASNIGDNVVRSLYEKGIKSFAVDFSLNYIFTTLLKIQNSRIRII